MLKLGELAAILRVDKDPFERGLDEAERRFRRSGKDMERDATTSGHALGLALGAGGAIGGDKFTRDATGRLRDNRGRFVREGELLGQVAGEGFGNALAFLRNAVGNFGTGLTNVTTNLWNLIPAMTALGAVAMLAVPAVTLLGGALGSLPALSVGLGAGIGVLALGFMGLSDQFKKTSSAGGAVVDKAWQIAQAERRVRDANLEVLAATEALSRARETAAERIDDLNRSITGAHLDEEAAVLAVADAEQALADARRTGTADDVKKADLALRQQKQTLDDIRERLGDMEQEQKRNAQQGVEGSDEVRSAYDRQRKAVEGVADAEHSLAEARKPAPGGGGAASDIMKIAPAAAAAVAVIKSLKPAFDDLRLDVQQRLFAGVGSEIRSLADAWLPTLHSKLGAVAGTFNGLFKTFSAEAKKPEFIDNIGQGLDAVDRLIGKVGGAVAGPFVDAWGRLSAAASPFLDAVGDEVAGLVETFSKWIKQADESGALKDFFKTAGDFFRDGVSLGKDLGAILGDFFSMWTDSENGAASKDLFQTIKDGIADLRVWLQDPENKKNLKDFVDGFVLLGTITMDVFGWLVGTGIPAVWGAIDWLAGGIDWLTDKAGQAASWIVNKWNGLIDWVGGLPARISAATSGMWDGIKDSFRSAVNWIIGRWNNLSFTVGGGTILGQTVPSMTLNTPNIPMLADGGIVRATPGGRLVGVAEGGQDEAVIPLSKLDGMMRGQQITVKFQADDSAVMAMLLRNIRYTVVGDYGGDVTAALAGR